MNAENTIIGTINRKRLALYGYFQRMHSNRYSTGQPTYEENARRGRNHDGQGH